MAVVVTASVQSDSPLRTVQTRPESTPVQDQAPTSATVEESEPS
jgi:hypothetical protein